MPKPFVLVKLDKERRIRFTFQSLLEIEEHHGVKYHEIKPETFNLKDMLYLLYQGLKHEDPSLTEEEVVRIADEAESMTYLFEKVAQAFTLAFVGKLPEDKEKNRKASS